MLINDETKDLLLIAKKLPEPLCEFQLDREIHFLIESHDIYSNLSAIREIVYSHFPDDPSITLGVLLPLISPMYWETISGVSRENIMSLRDHKKCISLESYNRNVRLNRFLKKIIKIYLINTNKFIQTLVMRYKELNNTEIISDLKKRLNALEMFEDSIGRGEWPRLFLMVPMHTNIMPYDISFTNTSHMTIYLMRGEKRTDHHGQFDYYPNETNTLKLAFRRRWELSLDYVKDRPEWPIELKNPDDVGIFAEQLKYFNIKSIEIIKNILIRLIENREGLRMQSPSVFISYSWDSDPHKTWVRDLAARLRSDGIVTILDQWETAPGDQLPQFMEQSVRENDFVIIICTPNYKNRSDSRMGGVGYEGDIMTAEIFTSGNQRKSIQRKFIPILRSGSWRESAPSWLLGDYYIDLTGVTYSEDNYQDLISTLLGNRPSAPPVGER